MDKIILKVISIFLLVLFLILVLSFIYVINPGTYTWNLIIGGINIFAFLSLMVFMMITHIFIFRLILQVEEFGKRFITNVLIFFVCMISITTFGYIGYYLLISRSNNELLLIWIIFGRYICFIMVLNGVFLIFNVTISSCYSCYKCGQSLLDHNVRNKPIVMSRCMV